MKTIISLLSFLLVNVITGQDVKISEPITPVTLKQKIIKGHAKNNLVYTYAGWCAPCIEQFPRVIEFCRSNDVALYIIVLSKKGNENLDPLKEKFKRQYNWDTSNLFNYKHNEQFYPKKTKNRFKDYQAFMAEFLAESYRPDYIYGSNIMTLMDHDAKIKVVSAEGSYDEIFQRLKDNL